jgi:hypothetical protein
MKIIFKPIVKISDNETDAFIFLKLRRTWAQNPINITDSMLKNNVSAVVGRFNTAVHFGLGK